MIFNALIIFLVLRFTPLLEYIGLGLLYLSAISRNNFDSVNSKYSLMMTRACGLEFVGVYSITDKSVVCHTSHRSDLIDDLKVVKKAISSNIKYLLTQ